MPNKVRASHILVKEKSKATQLKEQITDQKSFAKLAQKHSLCPSGRNGGDLNWFGRGQMVNEFEVAAFENDVGTIVGPVKTQFGYHLIIVTGHE